MLFQYHSGSEGNRSVGAWIPSGEQAIAFLGFGIFEEGEMAVQHAKKLPFGKG